MHYKCLLKLGLVGCGLMGSHYADVFSRMKGFSVAACCDPTPEKLTAFAREKKIPGTYTDYRDMLKSENLDGLLNVTPDHLHASVAIAALEAGIPLMTEKPLAANMEEARQLYRAAAISGNPVIVNFSKRNAAAVVAAGRILNRGLLGELLSIDTSYRQGWVFTRDWGDWREVSSWTWRLSSATAPLGVLSDLGSHLIDLIRYTTGKEIISVRGALLRTLDKDIKEIGGLRLDSPDMVQAGLGLEGGANAYIHCSRVDAGETDHLEMTAYGSKGRLVLDLEKDRKGILVSPIEDINLPEGFLDSEGRPLSRLKAGEDTKLCVPQPEGNYRSFAGILAGRNPDGPGIHDGFRVQAVMDSVIESASGSGILVIPEDSL